MSPMTILAYVLERDPKPQHKGIRVQGRALYSFRVEVMELGVQGGQIVRIHRAEYQMGKSSMKKKLQRPGEDLSLSIQLSADQHMWMRKVATAREGSKEIILGVQWVRQNSCS